jgi:hypothetical protein
MLQAQCTKIPIFDFEMIWYTHEWRRPLQCYDPLVQRRAANLGDFPPKNANLGILLAFGKLGDF